MGIAFTEVAKSEIKDHISIAASSYAGFINNIYNKINTKAEETQFKPIKDIADKLCVILPTQFFVNFTEKSIDLLNQSVLSFKKVVSAVKGGQRAEDAADDFTAEVKTASESSFLLEIHEPTGSCGEFDVNEEDLSQLCSDVAFEIAELKIYSKQAEDEILEKMQENAMYVAVLVLNRARSAMTIAVCESIYAAVKKLEDLYLDRVELIRKTRADISPNISLENLLSLGMYPSIKGMGTAAGGGAYDAGRKDAGDIPVPEGMPSEDLPGEAPLDMNVDGECFNREEQFKYFGFNFIDSRSLTTDDEGNVSAMDEFGRWLSSSMHSKKISCEDVMTILPAYGQCLMSTQAEHFSADGFLESLNSNSLFEGTVPADGMTALTELLQKAQQHCENTRLDKAAECFAPVAAFADGYNCPDRERYCGACDTMSQALFSMINSAVDFDDYIEYKIMKGDIAGGE